MPPPPPGATFDRNEARTAMPRAFAAFLGAYPRITPIQAAAFPVLASGRDAVLVAPAASGKTEAALVPLCERLLHLPSRAGAGILYVVPTRALANDIEVRCRGPAASLRLDLVIRTGDRPTAVADRDVGVLVTTPESFDSLLCRAPRLFSALGAAVVDEAHLMDGTYRGDQLRILFRRLLRGLKRRPQLVAMSATIADPAAVGRRLFDADAVVVRAGADRPVRIDSAPDAPSAIRALRAAGVTKALVFCNSRRRVEEVSFAIAAAGIWPRERVMVHHASLPRREREDVERAFRRWEAGILVATTTLELGVDIGDVDAVVLVGAPETSAAFRQRVGRGCRRKAGMVAICVPEDDADREAFDGIRAALDGGDLPPMPYVPDLSVAVQQAFSTLFGAPRGLRRADLLALLAPLGTRGDLSGILDHLVSEGHLESASGDRLVASTAVMDMGERGRIHGNIPDGRTVKVVDSATGRVVGEVSAAGLGARAGAADDGTLALGGRSWRVTGSSGGTGPGAFGRGADHIRVSSAGGVGAPGVAPLFARRAEVGAFHRYLPERLRRRVR